MNLFENVNVEVGNGTTQWSIVTQMCDMIPCILHMENCVGLKILTVSLVEGLSNVKKGNVMEGISGLDQRESPGSLDANRSLMTLPYVDQGSFRDLTALT